jgi:hypothetical protein
MDEKKEKLLQDLVNRLYWMNAYMEKLTGGDSLHTTTLLVEAKALGVTPVPELRFGYTIMARNRLNIEPAEKVGPT